MIKFARLLKIKTNKKTETTDRLQANQQSTNKKCMDSLKMGINKRSCNQTSMFLPTKRQGSNEISKSYLQSYIQYNIARLRDKLIRQRTIDQHKSMSLIRVAYISYDYNWRLSVTTDKPQIYVLVKENAQHYLITYSEHKSYKWIICKLTQLTQTQLWWCR